MRTQTTFCVCGAHRSLAFSLAVIACLAAIRVEGAEFQVTAPPLDLQPFPEFLYRFAPPPRTWSLRRCWGARRWPDPARFRITRIVPRYDPFFEKYVSAGGYPIVSSGRVSDYALQEAAYLVNLMLSERPDVRQAMIDSRSRMVIMAHDEFTTDVPDYDHFRPKDYWDKRARGLGGSQTDPVCSVAEENVLGFAGDPYKSECILIHEFAHNIHLRGMVNVDPTFDRRLQQAYESAMSAKLWQDKYAAVNHHEYWAEGVQSWFNNNRPPDHDHNHVDTRRELVEYDPRLAQLCQEVFGDTQLVYTKPATRLVGHLKGYDPATAPTFRWPERLAAVQLDLRLKWNAAADASPPNSATTSAPAWLLVKNRTDRRVKLFWVDDRGQRKPYGELAPGATRSLSTYAEHTWLITAENDDPLGYFIAKSPFANAVIPDRD